MVVVVVELVVVVVMTGFGRVVVVVVGGRVVEVVLRGRVVVVGSVVLAVVVPVAGPVGPGGSASVDEVVELDEVDGVEVVDEPTLLPSASVEVGPAGSCWTPSTSTGSRPDSPLPSTRIAPTQAATTHQNHRPSRTRCTSGR